MLRADKPSDSLGYLLKPRDLIGVHESVSQIRGVPFLQRFLKNIDLRKTDAYDDDQLQLGAGQIDPL